MYVFAEWFVNDLFPFLIRSVWYTITLYFVINVINQIPVNQIQLKKKRVKFRRA